MVVMARGMAGSIFILAVVTVMIVVIVIRVGVMIKIQDHIRKQHVMVVAMGGDRVLYTSHGTGHGCLHANKDQSGAQHSAGLLQGIGPRIHAETVARATPCWQSGYNLTPKRAATSTVMP